MLSLSVAIAKRGISITNNYFLREDVSRAVHRREKIILQFEGAVCSCDGKGKDA